VRRKISAACPSPEGFYYRNTRNPGQLGIALNLTGIPRPVELGDATRIATCRVVIEKHPNLEASRCVRRLQNRLVISPSLSRANASSSPVHSQGSRQRQLRKPHVPYKLLPWGLYKARLVPILGLSAFAAFSSFQLFPRPLMQARTQVHTGISVLYPRCKAFRER
jgi:hypothetical protein